MFERLFGKRNKAEEKKSAPAEIPAARMASALAPNRISEPPKETIHKQTEIPRPRTAIFSSIEELCADTRNRLSPETRSHIDETVARLQEKWRRDKELALEGLEQKRKYAREQFGKSSPPALLMDKLIGLVPEGRYDEGKKEIKAELRSAGPAARRDLFKFLISLKKDLNWGDHPAETLAKISCNRQINTDEFRFELIIENQIKFLLENGFEIDAGLAEFVLDYIANGVTPYYLQLRDQMLRDYQNINLGIIKQIASNAEKGMEISSKARNDAKIIFDRYCNIENGDHQAFFKSGRKMDNVCEALLAIGQVERPTSLLEQYRSNDDCRAVRKLKADDARINTYHQLELAYKEAWQLIDDIKQYKAGQAQGRNWLTDAQIFNQKFGITGEPPSRALTYGWWQQETMGEDGFAKVVDNKEFLQLAEWFDYIITPDELEFVINYLSGDSSFSPYVYSLRAIPDIEAFSFDGHDSNGKFLDHVTSSNASKPGKSWLKTTSALVKEIGADNLYDGIERWTSHLFDDGIEKIDWKFVKAARWYERSADNFQQEYSDWPDKQNPECFHKRFAMKMVAGGGAYLSNGNCPEKYNFSDDYISEQSYARNAMDRELSDINVSVMCGVIWAASLLPDERVPALLEKLGKEMFRKRYGKFRSKKCGNAVLWSLGQIGTMPAVYALARIRRSIKDKSIATLVDSALTEAAQQHGLALDDMQELSMADYGIGPDACRTEMFGQYAVKLEVTTSKKATLTTFDTSDPNAKPKRGIIKAAKDKAEDIDLVDELIAARDDIERLLPEARQRLENTWRHNRSWSFTVWKDRFYDNGLVATLSRRLIWTFETGQGAKLHLIPTATQDEYFDISGNKSSHDLSNTTVRLWHPILNEETQVAEWRNTLRQLQIRQPFMQAWRPIYVITDAERQTATYSNRFSGHILHQPPVVAMFRKRGWASNSRILGHAPSDEKQNQIVLPAFGVGAEYWVSGIGDRIQQPTYEQQCKNYGWADNFEYISTDRLTFFEIDQATGKLKKDPMSIEQVPTMALTEVMRDIDTVVGITSIGNDRFWNDRGSDALPPISSVAGAAAYRDQFVMENKGELSKMRMAFLQTILPSLAIANQCTLTDKWLIVDGKLKTYKIHLGSGNSLIASNDRYLCIVQNQIASREEDGYYLPFEGDPILSMILSKAFMLADDDKITDPIIVSQICAPGG